MTNINIEILNITKIDEHEHHIEGVQIVTLYEKMKKYKVEASSVEDFLKKYYKPERYTGRGKEYAQYLLQKYKKELKEKGYCFISGHDCVMGRAAAYYGDKEESF